MSRQVATKCNYKCHSGFASTTPLWYIGQQYKDQYVRPFIRRSLSFWWIFLFVFYISASLSSPFQCWLTIKFALDLKHSIWNKIISTKDEFWTDMDKHLWFISIRHHIHTEKQNKKEKKVVLPLARAANLSARFPGDASKTSTDQNMLSANDLSVSVIHQ